MYGIMLLFITYCNGDIIFSTIICMYVRIDLIIYYYIMLKYSTL